jgi:squalene cyclase
MGGRAGDRTARMAAESLLRTQLPDGSWPRQGMIGVFNRTVLIDYDNYRRYFPVWALASYAASLAS